MAIVLMSNGRFDAAEYVKVIEPLCGHFGTREVVVPCGEDDADSCVRSMRVT
jgi:hypothetical protein